MVLYPNCPGIGKDGKILPDIPLQSPRAMSLQDVICILKDSYLLGSNLTDYPNGKAGTRKG